LEIRQSPWLSFPYPKVLCCQRKGSRVPKSLQGKKNSVTDKSLGKKLSLQDTTVQQSQFGQPVASKCTHSESRLLWLQVTGNSVSNWLGCQGAGKLPKPSPSPLTGLRIGFILEPVHPCWLTAGSTVGCTSTRGKKNLEED
jgi:hypothetical protein